MSPRDRDDRDSLPTDPNDEPLDRPEADVSEVRDPGPVPVTETRVPLMRKDRGRNWLARIFAVIVLTPALIFMIWAAITLNFAYSTGERFGYVQKFSQKGWLCKTWEGELQMISAPGVPAQIFPFTVRNDSVAGAIQDAIGKRVAVQYDQHRGVPTSCFGETEYFVKGLRLVEP